MFTAIALTGCGDSCFVGFSNNGNGGLIVKVANPPPSCSLSQVHGAMSVVALKSSLCETCTAATRVEHVFVTLRGIQLRPGASEDARSPNWLELAPHLAKEPRQIDLMGNPMPIILSRVQTFLREAIAKSAYNFSMAPPQAPKNSPAVNVCGETRWNCIVMADGHVERLRLPGDPPELLIPSQSIENDSVVVLPDARVDLQLSLEPHQGYYISSSEGWRLQSTLVGRATVVRQRSLEAETSTPDRGLAPGIS